MKTIEEAAREAVRKEYLCESCAWKNDCDLCGGENTAFDCCECPVDSYEDGFKAGANHIKSLPLAERLTAEERKKIKNLYLSDEEVEGVKTAFGAYPVAVATITKNMLESIFGKDMFEEKGGSK